MCSRTRNTTLKFFLYSFQDMFQSYFNITEIIPGLGGGTNDVRVIGASTMIILLIITIVGMDMVNRVSIFFISFHSFLFKIYVSF